MKSILYEVKMSPARLEKMSASANATVGFEIELAVPVLEKKELPNKSFKNFAQIQQFVEKFAPHLQPAISKIQQEIDQVARSINSKNPSAIKRAEEKYIATHYPQSASLEKLTSTFAAVGRDIQQVLNKPTKSSDGQHSVARDSTHYIVETDSSIRPPKGFQGIEIVSPPMPLSEAISDLKKLHRWAKDSGAITNNSTGLHIGVSLPNMDSVDFLKLAVFVGDEYVLDQFSRSSNIYSPSTIREIKKRTEEFYSSPKEFNRLQSLFVQLKHNLSTNAERALQMFPVGIKNMSLHFKTSYVEFRSPGGNWLEDQEFDTVVATINRFVVALAIAADPNKYAREYSIKLFKLLDLPSTTGIDLFSKWASGSASLEAVKQHQSQVPVVIVNSSSKPVRVLKDNTPVAIVFGTSNSEIKQGLRSANVDFEKEASQGAKFSIVSLTSSEQSELNLKTAIRS